MDMHCREDEITIRHSHGDGWYASGCGRNVRYRCTLVHAIDLVCVLAGDAASDVSAPGDAHEGG
jgi:hypothetical protein